MLKKWFLMAAILPALAQGTPLEREEQQAMWHLLLQDCGSCHGMTLKGGLGPALPAQRMRELGDENVQAVIRHGRPGTPMPPWGERLSDAQIAYLSEILRAGIER